MDKAIVLLSGGLNSAVAAARIAESHELYMVFANLHQRPLVPELRAFEALCKHFEVKYHWKAELSHFKQVGGNALVDTKRDVEDAEMLENDIAGTYVAGLMPTLLDVATAFAFRIGAKVIVTGVSSAISEPAPGNAVLYPDNQALFIQNYQYMLESALPAGNQLTVQAPLLDFDRSEIVQLGLRLKVPLKDTWSCYQAGETPCGTCFGCASRALGFLKAGQPDPLILPGAVRS